MKRWMFKHLAISTRPGVLTSGFVFLKAEFRVAICFLSAMLQTDGHGEKEGDSEIRRKEIGFSEKKIEITGLRKSRYVEESTASHVPA